MGQMDAQDRLEYNLRKLGDSLQRDDSTGSSDLPYEAASILSYVNEIEFQLQTIPAHSPAQRPELSEEVTSSIVSFSGAKCSPGNLANRLLNDTQIAKICTYKLLKLFCSLISKFRVGRSLALYLSKASYSIMRLSRTGPIRMKALELFSSLALEIPNENPPESSSGEHILKIIELMSLAGTNDHQLRATALHSLSYLTEADCHKFTMDVIQAMNKFILSSASIALSGRASMHLIKQTLFTTRVFIASFPQFDESCDISRIVPKLKELMQTG